MELFSQIFLLCPASLPAVTPIENKELEAESVDLDGWLEADTQVVIVHFVELRTRVQKADVAGDGEEQIVVEGWQLGKLILQHLRRGLRALALLLDAVLDRLGEDLVRQLTKPVLEQRTDNVGVVEVVIRDKIDVAVFGMLVYMVL